MLRSIAVFAAVLSMIIGLSCSDDPLRIPVGVNDILTVPDDYATPQAAVDAAEPGDLVQIRPGIYTHLETRFPGSEEFPRGLRAALFMRDSVLVEGLGAPGEVVFRDTTGSDTTYGVAFLSTGNRTAFANISFEGYHIGAVVEGGGGQIISSRFAESAAGIWLFRAENPIVFGNLVEDCSLDGILNQFTDAEIRQNLVRRCGAGVGVEFPGSPFIAGNLLCGNKVGIGANTEASPVIVHNIVLDNSVAGMMFATGAVPIAVENDIYENEVGIFVDFYATPLEEPLNCESNYWDTIDLEAIEDTRIRDQNDDPSAGAMVDFIPIVDGSWIGLSSDIPELFRRPGDFCVESSEAALARVWASGMSQFRSVLP